MVKVVLRFVKYAFGFRREKISYPWVLLHRVLATQKCISKYGDSFHYRLPEVMPLLSCDWDTSKIHQYED